jgi:pyruvate dehydrogenase (quinone)
MVKLEMMVAGFPDYVTDFKHCNFAKIAETGGVIGVRVEDPASGRALQEPFAQSAPAVVDVVNYSYELSMP